MPTYAVQSIIDGQPTFGTPLNEILAQCKAGGAVKVLDPDECISEQQNKWLHCKDGPVMMLMRTDKMGFMEAKLYLKTEFGWHWFVKDVIPADVKSCTDPIYWYCNVTACEKRSFHLLQADREGNIYVCPGCGSSDIKLISIKSINKKAVSVIRLWFDEIIKHYPQDLLPPNPELKKKA